MSKEDRQLAADLRREFGSADELRASLQSFGWHSRYPAIEDEYGNVLVGNRRLAVARELGITPVIEKVKFGNGDEADAERLKLALISNA
jgi:ParB-like chromosome segregation protein Spo0J